MTTLFIDIDDTLLHEVPVDSGSLVKGRILMGLLRDLSVETHRHDAATAERIITRVEAQKPFWTWGDFLEPLGLDPATFWQVADVRMRPYFVPLHPDLTSALTRLRELGCALWIISNNPTDGVAHKLRLAGLSDVDQNKFLSGVLSTDRLKGCKPDAATWVGALQIANCRADEVTVIGDNAKDDMRVPACVGISSGLLISHAGESLVPGWCHAVNFEAAIAAIERRCCNVR